MVINMTAAIHVSLTEKDSANLAVISDYYDEVRGVRPNNSQIVKELLAKESMRIQRELGNK